MQLILATILVCAIFSNAPSLGGDFVFDDSEAILGNSDVTGNKSLLELFHHDFWGKDIQSNRSHKSYRPITVLSFRIDAYWGSGDLLAVVFHFHNIVLYTLVCMLYRHTVERSVAVYLGKDKFVDLYVQWISVIRTYSSTPNDVLITGFLCISM